MAAITVSAALTVIGNMARCIVRQCISDRPLATWLPGNLTRSQAWTRRVDRGDAEVVVEEGRTTRRLIPDIDADAAGYTGRLLDRWVSYGNIAADPGVGRCRKDHDPIRVSVGSVFLDEVAVSVEDADAEIIVWTCEAISRRLVPPERVVGADDSYAAAGQACDSAPIPDSHIRSKSDTRRRRGHANAGHTVRRCGDPFDLAEQRAVEQDSITAESLHDAGSTDLDVRLSAAMDAGFCCRRRRATARRIRVGWSRDRESVQPQLDVTAGELNARRARDGARDVADESTVIPNHSSGRYRTADVLREHRARRQEDADCDRGETAPDSAGSHGSRPFRMA